MLGRVSGDWLGSMRLLGVGSVGPPADSPLAADYCYYVNSDQSIYILYTKTELPVSSPFTDNIDISKVNFTLLSSSSDEKTSCPNPQAIVTVIPCADPQNLCLAGGGQEVLDSLIRAAVRETAEEQDVNLESPDRDLDQDGLTESEEKFYGTDSQNPDTDGDGYLDGQEVESGYNPLGAGKLPSLVYPDDYILKPEELLPG